MPTKAETLSPPAHLTPDPQPLTTPGTQQITEQEFMPDMGRTYHLSLDSQTPATTSQQPEDQLDFLLFKH